MISSVLSHYSLFSFSVFDQSIILHIRDLLILSPCLVLTLSALSLSLSFSLITHTYTHHAHTTVIHTHKTYYRTPFLSAIYSSIFLHEYLHRINLNHAELKSLINYKRRSNAHNTVLHMHVLVYVSFICMCRPSLMRTCIMSYIWCFLY